MFSVSGFRLRVLGVGFSVLGFGVLFYRVECLMFKVCLGLVVAGVFGIFLSWGCGLGCGWG